MFNYKIASLYQFIILIIQLFQQNMDIEKPLQETSLSQVIIEGTFFMNNLPTRVVLFSDSFYFANEKLQCTYALNFDFSYDIIRDANGWTLTVICPESYKFFSLVCLDDWEEILMNTMKRRRFHEFFKGVKKIGKGNFASVYLT